MKIRLFVIMTVALVVLPLAFFGCKGKTEKALETSGMDETSGTAMTQEETMAVQPVEPAQNVGMETIPPTAAPQITPAATPQAGGMREREIQKALKNAGFYAGTIDGKIGPKTKNAIMEFQKAKGLTVDGKVGPKTWAELEKHLTQ